MQKIYNYNNEVVNNLFRKNIKKEIDATFTLESILNTVTNSLCIFNSNKFLVESINQKLIDALQGEKYLFAVTGLDKVKVPSNSNMAIRHANIKNEIGFVLVDKTDLYMILSNNKLVKTIANTSLVKEMLEYFNYYFWGEAELENFSGKESAYKNTIAVALPSLSSLSSEKELGKLTVSSVGMNLGTMYSILNDTNTYQKNTIVINDFNNKIASNDSNAFVKFNDKYIKLECKAIEFADYISVDQVKFSDIVKEEGIVVSGSKFYVDEKYVINEVKQVTLDVLDTYNPDFDTYLKSVKGNQCIIEINVDVKPFILDETYNKHDNYSYIDYINNQIKERFETMINLDLKVKKQYEKIIKLSDLKEKVEKTNQVITEEILGVEVMKNKNTKIKTIDFDLSRTIVPHELLGTMVTKNKKNYIATSTKKLTEVLDFINLNKLAVEVILDESR